MHQKYTEIELSKLNFIRIIFVLMVAFGYASTMPLGPLLENGDARPEKMQMLGYDPSWVGVSVLFFFSGFLALKSLWRHGSSVKFIESRFLRNIPILALVTFLIVIMIYPLFGSPEGGFLHNAGKLTLYFLGTVSCLWVSEPLPGLMDDAKYMCLVQGAIWTFQWGLIAYVGMAVLNILKLLNNRRIVLVLAIGSTLAYIILFQLHINQIFQLPSSIHPGPRLAWPFLMGAATYAYWDKMPKSTVKNLLIGLFMLGASTAYFYVPFYLPWTAGIEILLIMGWAWLGVAVLTIKTDALTFLNNWSPIALALYAINWPTSQVLLLINPDLGSWGLIAVSLPLSVALAFFIHAIFGRTVTAFANRRNDREMAAALPA